MVAYVAAAEGCALDEEVLTQHCRSVLSAYNRPRAFSLVDSFPLTAVGRIDKKALRGDERVVIRS